MQEKKYAGLFFYLAPNTFLLINYIKEILNYFNGQYIVDGIRFAAYIAIADLFFLLCLIFLRPSIKPAKYFWGCIIAIVLVNGSICIDPVRYIPFSGSIAVSLAIAYGIIVIRKTKT